jgi:hypothetical protein
MEKSGEQLTEFPADMMDKSGIIKSQTRFDLQQYNDNLEKFYQEMRQDFDWLVENPCCDERNVFSIYQKILLAQKDGLDIEIIRKEFCDVLEIVIFARYNVFCVAFRMSVVTFSAKDEVSLIKVKEWFDSVRDFRSNCLSFMNFDPCKYFEAALQRSEAMFVALASFRENRKTYELMKGEEAPVEILDAELQFDDVSTQLTKVSENDDEITTAVFKMISDQNTGVVTSIDHVLQGNAEGDVTDQADKSAN